MFSLENTHAWAKAGVMLRESLAPGSKYVTLVATPGKGLAMQARSLNDRQSYDVALLAGTIPKWVRVIRRGDVFTGSVSDDGFQWRNVGAVRVEMNTVLRAGLAVTSHAAGTLATAIFQSQYIEP